MSDCLRPLATADGTAPEARRITQPLDWLEAALGSLLPAQLDRVMAAIPPGSAPADSLPGMQLDQLRQLVVYLNHAIYYCRHSCKGSDYTAVFTYLESHRRQWNASGNPAGTLAMPDNNMVLPMLAQVQADALARPFRPLAASAAAAANASASRAATTAAATMAAAAAASGSLSSASVSKSNDLCRRFAASNCNYTNCKYRHRCQHCGEEPATHSPAACPKMPPKPAI